MRLLAYGGTSYDERCRIAPGALGSIPPGTLSDTYGLSEEELSYGLGLLADLQPFLIVRQKQNIHDRGGYAYTLLLDPGRNVWERFGWNAAALALALFGSADSPGRVLLTVERDFSAEQLNALLEDLQPSTAEPPDGEASIFLTLWVGALLLPAPAAAAGIITIVISPQSAGLEIRPSLQTMAALLDTLPQCFRGGMGWSVGSSKKHGPYFGLRFVLDEKQDSDSTTSLQCIEAGRKILAAWTVVLSDEEFKAAITRESETPIWEWQSRLGHDPQLLIDRVTLLAEFLRPSQSVDALLSLLEPQLQGSELLAEPIRHASRRLALEGEDQLSAQRTKLILDDYFDRKIEVGEDATVRLDEETVINTLIARRVRPPSIYDSIPLSKGTSFQVWRGLILGESDTGKTPVMLRAAVEALNDLTEEDDITNDELLELADAAVEHSIVRGGSLRVWLPFRNDQVIGMLIRSRLREEAIREAKTASENWQLDYLAFGQDTGGLVLSRLGLSELQLQRAVEDFIESARSADGLAGEAKDWLAALALSPLRQDIPLRLKLDLAETISHSEWGYLGELWRLYHGDKRDSAKTVENDGTVRTPFLLSEFRAMLEGSPPIDFVPNLNGIAGLLPAIPLDTVEIFSHFTPPLSNENIEGWLQGWLTLGRPDIYHREVLRSFMEAPLSAPLQFTSAQLEDDQLSQLCDDLIFGGTEKDDERRRDKVVELCELSQADKRFQEIFTVAFNTGTQEELGVAAFARRFTRHFSVLEVVFNNLNNAAQDRAVALLAEYSPATFQSDAYSAYQTAVRDLPDKIGELSQSDEIEDFYDQQEADATGAKSSWRIKAMRWGKHLAHYFHYLSARIFAKEEGGLPDSDTSVQESENSEYTAAAVSANPLYMRAVWRYLLSPEGRSVKNQIGIKCHGSTRGDLIDENMKELLDKRKEEDGSLQVKLNGKSQASSNKMRATTKNKADDIDAADEHDPSPFPDPTPEIDAYSIPPLSKVLNSLGSKGRDSNSSSDKTNATAKKPRKRKGGSS
jgi:hypothetical protein